MRKSLMSMESKTSDKYETFCSVCFFGKQPYRRYGILQWLLLMGNK